MSEMLPPLIIELQAKTDELTARLGEVESKLKVVGHTATTEAGHVESFGAKLTELGKRAMEIFAVKEVFDFLAEAGKEAAKNSESFATFALTLKNVTGASNEQTEALNKQIEAMALQSGHVAEDLRPAFEKLVSVTKDSGKAMGMLSLAQDVAAAKHKDLSVVAAAMSKALAGNSAALNKIAPETKGSADAFAMLAKNTHGAAAAVANANPYMKLNAAFTEMKEKIGAAVVPLVGKFADLIIKLMPTIDVLAGFVGKLVDSFTPLIDQLLSALMPIVTELIGVFMQVVGAIMPVVEAVLGALLPVLKPLADLFGRIVGVVLPPLVKILGAVLVPVINILVGALDGFLIPAWNRLVDVLQPVIGWIADSLVGAFKLLMQALEPLWKNVLEPAIQGLAKLLGLKVDFNVAANPVDATTQSILDGSFTGFDMGNLTPTPTPTPTGTDPVAAFIAKTADAIKAAHAKYTDSILKANQNFADLVQKQITDFRDVFQKATEVNVSTLFNQGFRSVDQLTAQLQTKLAQANQLAADAAKLSAAGYSAEFVKQVMSEGAVVGDQMAQSLLAAAPDQAAKLQELYKQTSNVATTGVNDLSLSITDQFSESTKALATAMNNAAVTLKASLEKIRGSVTAEGAKTGSTSRLKGVSGKLATETQYANQQIINVNATSTTQASPQAVANAIVSSIKFGLPITAGTGR